MKDLTIKPEISIRDSMRVLGETGEKCLLVVDSNRKLLGTLTDGDIRRGILKGMDIDSNIKTIYSKKPIVVTKGKYTHEQAKKLLNDHKQILLPVLEENGVLVNYLNWQDVFGVLKKNESLKDVQVVIMAGGKGARLEPFTKVLPKPLMPVNDKPVIEHIIEKFTFFGIMDFYLTVNYKSRILKSFFQELQPEYSVKFFDEKEPLGTAGGLKPHKEKFKDPFFVTNCDIIIDSDYSDIYNFHKSTKNDLTLVASTKDFEIPYGICELDKKGQLSDINEKPKQNFLANTGLYILNPDVLDLIPEDKFFHMTELIKNANKKKMKVGVYPIEDSKWLDIGQWSEYRKSLKFD